MTVLMAECTGLWRRTLIIEADGTHDTAPGVWWLQGPTAYVDSRGFAGTLSQDGSVFQWYRAVDVQPPGPFPDEGEMAWDGDILIETGVHEDYVEHWVRDPVATTPAGALFLAGPGSSAGVLVRAGDLFAWADPGGVAFGPVGGPEWAALGFTRSGVEVQANGVHWTIDDFEGNVEL